MIIVNKGTSKSWNIEDIESDNSVLGLSILGVLEGILNPSIDNQNYLKPKTKGIINEARIAMVHDIHGLAILHDMVQYTFKKGNDLKHKDFLYVMELIEKYFTNLRSIYDFMSKVLI